VELQAVMDELETLGTDYSKKRYLSNGAHEPVFGTATTKMKPMSKEINTNQELAEELYVTGNYDAMYFAGVIADAKGMTEADYERWITDAYFFMLSDYVVAVTLSEADFDFATKLSDKWIVSGEDLKMSAGWSCYCWLLGSRKDEEFSKEKLAKMLDRVAKTIHESPVETKDAMNNFVYTVGTSFVPLHEKALAVAETIVEVTVKRENKKPKTLNALENIQKQVEKDRIGFKRKYVRC